MFVKLRARAPRRSAEIPCSRSKPAGKGLYGRRSGIALELEKDSGQSAQKESRITTCELALVNDRIRARKGRSVIWRPRSPRHRKCVRANIILATGGGPRVISRRDRGWKAHRAAEPRVSRRRRQRCREPRGRASEEGLTLAAGVSRELSLARPARCRLPVDAGLGGPEAAYKLVRSSCAETRPARPGQAARGTAPGRARGRRHDLELVRNRIHSHTQRLRATIAKTADSGGQFYRTAVLPAAAGKPIRRAQRDSSSRHDAWSQIEVTIVGTGYVGLVSGAWFRRVGNDVLCLDLDSSKIRMLERARSRSTSPDCSSGQRNRAAGRLHFTHEVERPVRFRDSECIAVGRARRGRFRDLRTCSPRRGRSAGTLTEYRVIGGQVTVPVALRTRCAGRRGRARNAARHALRGGVEPRIPQGGAA